MSKLFALFERSSDAAFAVDDQQRIIFWNQTAETLTGYPAAAALGQPCWELLAGITQEGNPLCSAHCPILLQIKAGQPTANMDMAIRTNNGLMLPVNFSTIPVGPEGWNGAKSLLIHLLRPLQKTDERFGALRLYLLGPLRAQRQDGSFINSPYWQSPAVRALLVLLVQAHPQHVHQAVLAETLWPELPPKLAQGALDTAVTHLRLCLEPELASPWDSRTILQSATGYRLHADIPVWIDLEYVTRQLENARLEPNPRRASQMLTEVLVLFRGDYLADLCKTAVWTSQQHLKAQNLQIAALETLGDLQQQLGQPQEAKKHYLSALMLDPDGDSAYQKLIHLALPHGSKVAALQYCQRLANALRSELDIILDEEFRQLLQET